MITFVGSRDTGGRVLGFGLARANVERLQAGEPITARLDEMGLPGVSVVIWFGETEAAMEAELRGAGLIGDDCLVHAMRPEG